MRTEDYRRLRAVCLAMARQSQSPNVQARWFELAEVEAAGMKRAADLN
jgi:hypothetical protein